MNQLRKINFANPLYNLEEWDWLDKYNQAATDQELSNVLHGLLNYAENTNNKVLYSITMAMFDFSAEQSFNIDILIK